MNGFADLDKVLLTIKDGKNIATFIARKAVYSQVMIITFPLLNPFYTKTTNTSKPNLSQAKPRDENVNFGKLS